MPEASPRSDDLFESAVGMAAAANYADWTFSLFEPFVHGRVLEVGCGIGTFTQKLVRSPKIESLLSIDVSESAVARCRAEVQSPRLDVRKADVLEIAGQFDLVVCMNVLEHIEDDRRALAHMLGLLAPVGRLFLLVPAHQALFTSFDAESGHHRRYNKRRVRTLLGDAMPGGGLNVQQFYFNTIGALGYWVVYKALRKPPRGDASGEIGWFDRAVVPVQRRLEGRFMPFGLSLVSVISKGAAA